MPTELLAALGGTLLGSLLTGAFALLLHRSEQVTHKKEEMRSLIGKLLELRSEFETELPQIADPQARELAGAMLNRKKMMHLEACEAVTEQIPGHVTSSEYIVIADEMWSMSNFMAAETYYLAAIRHSRSALHKVTALRSLAGFYFGAHPMRDYDKGRSYFQQAIDVLKNPQDDYSIYTQGYTYEAWGWNEIQNGFQFEGEQRVDRARKYYNDLAPNNPLKAQALEWLELRFSQGVPVQPPSPEQTLHTPSQPLDPNVAGARPAD